MYKKKYLSIFSKGLRICHSSIPHKQKSKSPSRRSTSWLYADEHIAVQVVDQFIVSFSFPLYLTLDNAH